jgi:murein DD-endopeptidase MepM/ murein hydrolase activator NlpD
MKITLLYRLIVCLTPILPCFTGFSFANLTFHATAFTAPPSGSTLLGQSGWDQSGWGQSGWRQSGEGAIAEEMSRIQLSQAQQPQSETQESVCPPPALSRTTRHRIATGETVESIAQQYNLIPATLLGFNPALRTGSPAVGTELTIPPFNGIQVEVAAGTTWRDLAERYGVRADALFEVNGCQETPPRIAFVPGVNWSPTPSAPNTAAVANPLSVSPLPSIAQVLTSYGWQIDPNTEQYVFQSGVSLQAEAGTAVFATGAGTIAFAGTQETYGNLVVINHSQGIQTRYAQMGSIAVQIGQQVNAGDRIGTISMGDAPFLWFEVRSNSTVGWVAQDPGAYIPNIRAVDPVRRREVREE